MSRIGISGHRILTPDIADYAEREIRLLLAHEENLVGISNLAIGADQVFARVVLALNGSLEVIIPCLQVESSFDTAGDLQSYRALLSRATKITTMPFTQPSEDAYLAAGQEVVRASDHLIAVWDGRPARGKGGTADVVAHARASGVPVTVIWPPGALRA